ncbi:MAG: hypothetical protein PHE83_18205, partial [Opitutaceae bacterium]|nr:hypothetical protein [Opitutaceae bacterium]
METLEAELFDPGHQLPEALRRTPRQCRVDTLIQPADDLSAPPGVEAQRRNRLPAEEGFQRQNLVPRGIASITLESE